MPVSDAFLKNLLPFANGSFAPQAVTGFGDPLDAGAPPQAGAPMPGELAAPQAPQFVPPQPPPVSAMPGNQLDEAAVRSGLDASAANQAMHAASPPQGAPTPQGLPPGPAPAVPPDLPNLIPMRGTGKAAHEVDIVGDRQKSLIGSANDTRVQGIKNVEAQQLAAQDEIAKSAQFGAALEDAKASGARVAQAREAQRLDDQQQEINKAVSARAATPIKDYYADKSTGQRVLMGLALAIGAFGAGKTGSGNNPAMTMLNADMDRDLKTKEMRFRQQSADKQGKIDAAQQGFNNLVRQGGLAYARDAEAAATQRQMGYQAQILAAKTARPEIRARAEEMLAATTAKAKEFEAQAMIKFVPKKDGSVSFFDRKTGLPLTQAQAFKLQSEREARGEEQAGKIDVANIASQKGQKTSNDENRRFIGTQTQQAKIPEAMAAIDTAKKLALVAGDAGLGPVAHGIWARSPYLYEKTYGADAAAREQAFQAVANIDTHNISGGSVSKEELGRNVAKLYGAKNAASRAQALEAFSAPVSLAQKNIMAAAGPAAAAEYQQNQAALAPAPINFTPTPRK